MLLFIAVKQDCNAQSLMLKMKMGEHSLSLDSSYEVNQTDSIQITTVKFYLSDMAFWNNDSLLYAEKNSYHLIDLANPKSFYLHFDLPSGFTYNQIKFKLGIDSITSVSGSFGGDLDPINGMYWAWQSGYINSKIEGFYFKQGVKKEFQFHLGGYQYPFNSIQELTFKVDSQSSVFIAFDLLNFFPYLDLLKRSHLMQPSLDAVLLSRYLKNCFTVK